MGDRHASLRSVDGPTACVPSVGLGESSSAKPRFYLPCLLYFHRTRVSCFHLPRNVLTCSRRASYVVIHPRIPCRPYLPYLPPAFRDLLRSLPSLPSRNLATLAYGCRWLSSSSSPSSTSVPAFLLGTTQPVLSRRLLKERCPSSCRRDLWAEESGKVSRMSLVLSRFS